MLPYAHENFWVPFPKNFPTNNKSSYGISRSSVPYCSVISVKWESTKCNNVETNDVFIEAYIIADF